MKNVHALRCDLLLVLARIADRAMRVPETEQYAEMLLAVAARLEGAKRPAATNILMDAARVLGQIEGAWRVSSPATVVALGPDLDEACYFVQDILLYGTIVVVDDDDSEHALHEHENHAVPAREYEL